MSNKCLLPQHKELKSNLSMKKYVIHLQQQMKKPAQNQQQSSTNLELLISRQAF